MGMMHILRERMHIILWLLLILFVGSMTVGGLVGGADIVNQLLGKTDVSKTIAAVNGESISPDAFFQQVNIRLDGLRNQGQEIDDRTLDQVRSAVWGEMLELTLVNKEIERRKISITDDEVYHHLLNNPPQVIMTIPDFQTDGQFDRSKYLDALQNPQGDEWRPIEIFVRDYLPRQKLYDQIKEGVSVTREQVRAEFIKRNIDFTVSALVIRSFDMDDSLTAVTDEEIEDYYFLNPEEFSQDETRVLSYVKWDKVPSREDTTLVRQEVEELLERIESGEDFAALADEFSQDPGNKGPDGEGKEGDLGWFGRGQMVKPFEEAAFGASPGDIVGPVETTFGIHIIKVKDKRTEGEIEEVNASHILLKHSMGPTTKQRLKNQATQFTFDVEDYGFDQAVETNDLSVTTLKPITEDARFVSGFGYFSAPAKFAFDSQVGQVSDVLESEATFVVFRLDSIIAAGPRAFEEVQSQIRQNLKLRKQMELAKSKAQEAYNRLKEGDSFDEIASLDERMKSVGPVTRKLSASLPSIGRSQTVMGALLASKEGQILPPLEFSSGYAVIRLEDRTEIDETEWEVQRKTIQNEILVQRQNSAIREWLDELRTKAKIVDNRKYYF